MSERFFRVSATELEAWTVRSRTARTFQVELDHGRGFKSGRSIKSADIGRTWFETPEAAIEAKVVELDHELHWAKERVQRISTQQGMVRSLLKRLSEPVSA